MQRDVTVVRLAAHWLLSSTMHNSDDGDGPVHCLIVSLRQTTTIPCCSLRVEQRHIAGGLIVTIKVTKIGQTLSASTMTLLTLVGGRRFRQNIITFMLYLNIFFI